MADNKSLTEFLSVVDKTFGKKDSPFITKPREIFIEKFPTGSIRFDELLKGGYPKGTVIELFGENQSGKSSSAMEAARQFQEKYPTEPILWLDLEKVFDPAYFDGIGVNIETELFMLFDGKKMTGEKAYDLIHTFADKFKGGLIVVDSVPLLLPEKEDESDMGMATMGNAGRLNSQGMRKLLPKMAINNTTVILLNQIRDNIGGYGDTKKSTGGNAIPFYARTRIKVAKEKGEDGVSQLCRWTIEKANYGMPKGTVAKTELVFGKGFNPLYDLVDMATEKGIIQKSGSWFKYGETTIGQGAYGVQQVLEDNPELREEIEKLVRS
jgi:recombination protein RecA